MIGTGRAGVYHGGTLNGDISWITNFIWGIADDVLRDLYVRGKYRDVILPMVVLRRLDAVLEPTSADVVEMKKTLDEAGVVDQDLGLRQASGQSFYNTSAFTMRGLRARTNQQQLRADFEAYLDGFSPNVQEILDSFEFRHQIPRLSRADALGTLIEKFTDPAIDLSPAPDTGIDNHAMGSIFEELVRRFNEENNEEAGEHWTPRDAVRLMANLVFLPIADEIESGTYLVVRRRLWHGWHADGRRGDARTTRQGARQGSLDAPLRAGDQRGDRGDRQVRLLAQGRGGRRRQPRRRGRSTQRSQTTGSPAREFDFMLSNPPYGKSWKSDLERMGGKGAIHDPRFVIQHAGDPEYSLVTRSSDGQMLFLANMLSKMKHGTRLGSRIAEVHNGSSLFTGDAGQGESNIRRWIIENDWLEAIVALPLNMFYNTGIATYVWVLTNRKSEHRRGQVQLIRRHAVVQPAAQEPWQQELRALGERHRSDLRRLPRVRGERAVENLPERRLRLREGDRRAAAAAARRSRGGSARCIPGCMQRGGRGRTAGSRRCRRRTSRRWAARRLRRVPRGTRAAGAYGRPEADGQAKEAAAEQSGRARRGGAPGAEEGAPSRER